MIPEITREEHYEIMLGEPDNIAYCYEMYKKKSENHMEVTKFLQYMQLWIWRRFQAKMTGFTACEVIFKHFSKKFP